MKTLRFFFISAFFLLATAALFGAEQPPLDSHLEPLRPLLENTWKGTLENVKSDQPMVDVMRWERALNGKAVRVLHSLNDGLYGGETVIVWNEKKKSLTFQYFTTAGFTTSGTMTVKDGKISTQETVEGDAGGVTEVRGTSELLPDGGLKVKSEYLKDGKWEPGHTATYRKDPAAKVIFK